MSLIACAIAVVGGFAAAAEADGAEVVAATTTSGRVLVGVVDTRTDDHTLWLRRDSPSVSLALSAAWREIVAIEIDGDAIDKRDFRQRANKLATRRTVSEVWTATFPEDTPHPRVVRRTPPAPPRVAALRLAAAPANWDADAEADGLKVIVTPVDDRGLPTTAHGELRLRLLGSRRVSRHEIRFEQLAQWSTPVRAADFRDGVAVYRMPFVALAPEADTSIGALARLESRLGVSGGGAFEATAPVRLRAFDPLGDELQLDAGRRRFATQRSGLNQEPQPAGDGLFFSAPVGP